MAEIKWFGHACFEVRGRGVTVLMDPVPRESGYDIDSPDADIVTVSHEHPGHTAVDLVQPGFRLINGPGEYEIQEVFITGVQTYHDGDQGKTHGKNTVYVIEIDDLVIGHLGDIGHVLSEEQIEAMRSVDVVMVPVGGGPIITSSQAVEIVGQIEPGIVIPMQFRTDWGDASRDPVDPFISEMGIKEYEDERRLSVRKSDIGDSPRTVVLQPA